MKEPITCEKTMQKEEKKKSSSKRKKGILWFWGRMDRIRSLDDISKEGLQDQYDSPHDQMKESDDVLVAFPGKKKQHRYICIMWKTLPKHELEVVCLKWLTMTKWK